MAKLKTETDTPAMHDRVLREFLASDHADERYDDDFEAVFEHGQWWVHDKRTGASWSVVDVEIQNFRGKFDGGLDFEQVNAGEEE